MESSSFPATNNEAPPTSPDGPSSSWTHLGFSRHHAIIACAVLFGVLVLIFALWYLHRRRIRARPHHQRLHDPPAAAVPLHPLHYASAAEGNPLMAVPPAGDAPPRYEEVVPAQHQRLAGGMPDEEAGMVADGKMPLSEIPFEDVRLDSERAGQASRAVGEAQRGGGNTTGHTNS